MSVEAIFFLGAAITMGIVTFVIWYLRNPLQAILEDLCGNNERARFWSAFSHVVLFLVPLIAVLSEGPGLPFRQSGVFAISEQLKDGLVGLTASVVILGIVLSRYIARYVARPAEESGRAEEARHS